MQIKVIGYDKVKVLIETEDILRYHIPLSAWKEGDTECEEFIYILLREIYRQTGISFMHCEILTEIIQGISEAYYIIMTKTADSLSDMQTASKLCSERDQETFLFEVDRLADLLKIASVFWGDGIPCRSKLYRYQGRYYLLISFLYEVKKENRDFALARVGEFAKTVNATDGFAEKLSEYAVQIGGDDVLRPFICPK